nr:hypothetical protein [Tanacetum cinerariifolium]
AWVAKDGRMVLCYVQGSGRRKRKKGVGCGSGRQENYGSERRDCDGSDQDARYTLSKLLQRRTVAEYERKKLNIEEKIDIVLSWPSEEASLVTTGSLDANEDIGVVEQFSETKESVEEVVVGVGEACGVGKDELNRVIPELKDGGGEFDGRLDEINLNLSEELADNGVSPIPTSLVAHESLRVHQLWERIGVGSVTAWVAEDGRMVLCYVQGSGRRKWKKGVGCCSGRQENYGSGRRGCCRIRIWDPGIKKVFQDNTLRTRPTRGFVEVVATRDGPALKPLTLGYVFLLARMMEARLEDNRSTTTITKPYDLKETTFHKSNMVEETEARVEATVHKEKATTEKHETIKETTDTLTSFQSKVALLKAKGSLDTNEKIKKDHTLVHELEKRVEKLPIKLQLKNNVRGALETKDLKKMMIDLNPTLHDLQEVKTKCALKIDDE